VVDGTLDVERYESYGKLLAEGSKAPISLAALE